MAGGATFVGLHLTEWMNLINNEHVTAFSNEWGVPLVRRAPSSRITGLHMTHVVIGLIYLGIICQAVMRGKFKAEDVEVGRSLLALRRSGLDVRFPAGLPDVGQDLRSLP